jgi:hypothetical protein
MSALIGLKAVKKETLKGCTDTFFRGGMQVRHGKKVIYYIWSECLRPSRIDALADAHSVAFENDLTITAISR